MTRHSMARGGRLNQKPAEIFQDMTASAGFDGRLAPYDVVGSLAHVQMLAAQGIVRPSEARKIQQGLKKIQQKIEKGTFKSRKELDDIHMTIEAALHRLIGSAAGRLHTARSRNDQVATDLRLWLRDRLVALDGDLQALQGALLEQASAHIMTVMPGLTHQQNAQPISFAHHVLAYGDMLDRDRQRLAACHGRVNESPLGSAALAGTSFPIDRKATAAALGFDRPMANAIDAISARDFAMEFLAVTSICSLHLSRLAADMVLWMSTPLGFVSLPDSLVSSSSIMPQKRNPDAAELVRGKTGRLIGHFTALASVIKGLPLGYAMDLQEDKQAVFDAADTIDLSVRCMTEMVKGMTVNADAMAAAAGHGYTTATDLADWLVRVADVPFRQAHRITGRVVSLAVRKKCDLEDLSLTELQKIDPRFTAQARRVLSPMASMQSRTSEGGTAPGQVRRALVRARRRYQKNFL
ncbi:MAG: argininosuccinate lyase [Pseudomonadota bacterium]